MLRVTRRPSLPPVGIQRYPAQLGQVRDVILQPRVVPVPVPEIRKLELGRSQLAAQELCQVAVCLRPG
jgi:hypothetical protein